MTIQKYLGTILDQNSGKEETFGLVIPLKQVYTDLQFKINE